MYHHHSQQQGPPQPYSDRPRPSHHQQQSDQQKTLSVNDMLSPVMGFQFPRPTQLPEELESALSIRGPRDIDRRHTDHMNRQNQQQQQQQQSSGPGGYSSSSAQELDWTNYPPPTKLFASPPSNTTHQCQQQQVAQQQPQSSHSEAGMHSWNARVTDTHSPQAHSSRLSGKGGVDGKGVYTQESAGSILASFGLSNEDLEVLSHYPDDQLTPDTLPFILRDIQVNKSQVKNNPASSSLSTAFSQRMSRNISTVPPHPSRTSPSKMGLSPELPSLLSVTQTAGKVIDYGHASRTTDESCGKETFKREPLSNERKVKMVYPPLSSTLVPKQNVERRQVRLETIDTEHGDIDYRKSNSDLHKSKRSPPRESHLSKSQRLDQDYRRVTPKSNSSSKTRNELTNKSKSFSSVPKPHTSTKRLPTPTMISDFSGDPPKVYPHTCSLCNIECDQSKDWHDHINTVAHTAARRDLRRKYSDWKPISPRRDTQTADGSRTSWHPTKRSPPLSNSQSVSTSPTLNPPLRKPLRKDGRSYSPPQRLPRHTGSSPDGRKRPHDDFDKRPIVASRTVSSVSASKLAQKSKMRSSHPLAKTPAKPALKPLGTTLTAGSSKTDTAANTPPAKKKKMISAACKDSSDAPGVHLKDASKQIMTDVAGILSKTCSVILTPICKDKEGRYISGQKKPEKVKPLPDLNAGDATKTDPASETQGNEAKQNTPNKVQKGIVLISGLPDSGWSESDIINLAEPFGEPCEVIITPEFGKALVWLPNVETANEMLKVSSFSKVKIKDSELKMSIVKQAVSLDTPVALYNLLKRQLDTSEPPSPVGWSNLLVIKNVPKTPTGPTEVRKLIERFGVVQNSLVLNNNMIICEMATPAMALAVSKRFQKFPCIVQNHPLYFTRKADPKPGTQTKVTTAYLDMPKKPEEEKPLTDPNTGDATKTAPAGETQGSEAKQNTPNKVQKVIVLISGLPDSGWSESDIINLAEPFGEPCEVIVTPEFGKALVWLPNVETANEMLKVSSFSKVKIKDADLKMSVVKQAVSLDTPVALYNLLKRQLDTSEPPSPVGWSNLLVIKNVPKTPTGPTEVRKLIERFGVVQNSLVLNNNMIICEMATSAMALAVSKRFQKFPCIVQNHPLYFTREADPMPGTQTKATTENLDLPKTSDPLPAAAETNLKPMGSGEQMETAMEGKKTENELENAGGEERAVGEPSSVSLAQDDKLEVKMETPNAEIVTVKLLEDKPAEKNAGNGNNPGAKQAEPSSCDSTVTSSKCSNPVKVTSEMVEALLEECRTRSAGCADETTPPPGVKPENVQTKNPSGEARGRPGEEKKDVSNKNKGVEERRKDREREAKRDKDRKERERKERREREERREKEERRERERRRRHREGSSGSRTSGKSEGSRLRRDSHDRTTLAEEDKMVAEDCDEFPFDLDDFVTIDEVGDVTDFPNPPLLASMEDTHGASEERADKSKETSLATPPESVQIDPAQETPIAVATHKLESVPAVVATPTTESVPATTEGSGPAVGATPTTEGSAPAVEVTPTTEGSAPAVGATPTTEGTAPAVEATPTTEGTAPAVEATPTTEGNAPAVEATPTTESAPAVVATPTTDCALVMDTSEATPIVMSTTSESISALDNSEAADSAMTSSAPTPEAPQEPRPSEGVHPPAAQPQASPAPAAVTTAAHLSASTTKTAVDSLLPPAPASVEHASEAAPGPHVATPSPTVCPVDKKKEELGDVKQDGARERGRRSPHAPGPGLTSTPAPTPEASQEHCLSGDLPTHAANTKAPSAAEKTQPPSAAEKTQPPSAAEKTQPPPSAAEKTQPPPSAAEKTQPPPSAAEKTQPPSAAEKTQPPPSAAEKTQPPPAAEKTQPPPSAAEKTQPPPSAAEKTQPPPSAAEKTQPPPSAEKTQPPPSAEKTQPPPSAGKTPAPPLAGKTQPPPSAGKTQPPPSAGKTQAPPSAEKTPAPPLAEKTKAPPLAEKTPAPPLAEKTKASPLAEKTQVPPLAEKTQAPPLAEKTQAPPLAEKTPAPPPAEKTPAPPLAEKTSAPPLAEKTPAPPSAEKTPAPPLAEKTPAPPLAEKTPAPPSAEKTPAPPLAEKTPAPPSAEKTPAPPSAEKTPAPPSAEKTPAPPSAEKTKAPPSAEKTQAPPSAEKTPAPPLAEKTPAPPSAEKTPAPPSAEKTLAPPSAEKTLAPPLAEKTPAPPSAEKTTAPPSAEKTTAPPSAQPKPSPAAVKRQSPENERNGDEKSAKKQKTAPLPPFDPANAVGLEFLVPKTGFYCKVCNRFFSGSRQAEISHCKTLKHYENLQKHLQTG